MSAPKAIDLFAGCGGMSLGAARAGFEIAAAIDNDPKALAAHSRNFPTSKHLSFDLSVTTSQQILDAADLRQGEIDLVIGGPPCQGFSSIGKRKIGDNRNQRLSDFFRLVNEIRPKAFVVENVPGILTARYGKLFEHACSLVSGAYDVAEPHRIKGVDAGAPTIRTRVVVVGVRKDIAASLAQFWTKQELNQPTISAPVVRHALDGLPLDVHPDPARTRGGRRVVRVSREGNFFSSATGRIPAGVGDPAALEACVERGLVTGCLGSVHSAKLKRRYAALNHGQMDPKTKSVKLDPNGYCPTLRAGTGPEKGSFQAVRPIHYLRPRVITPREAARLQGFPDWFQFDETKWHSFRQIGNSVSPLVSEFVMKKVLGVLNA